MRRTQLYLDDYLWNTLHTCAHNQNTTVSELVREALRERYFSKRDQRAEAMQAFVGIRKGNSESSGAVEYIRSLRQGDRRSHRLDRRGQK